MALTPSTTSYWDCFFSFNAKIFSYNFKTFHSVTTVQYLSVFMDFLSAVSWLVCLCCVLYSCKQTPITQPCLCPCLRPHRSSLSSTLIHSPDSTTERSPSLLPRVKRFSEDASVNKAKRKKEYEPEVQEEDKQGNQEGVDKQKEGKQIEPELIKRSAAPLSNQSFMKEPLDIKVRDASRRLVWMSVIGKHSMSHRDMNCK